MRPKWKPVVGYEGFYEVSNFGGVRNAKSKKMLAVDHSDYGIYVELRRLEKRNSVPVARLVLMAFVGIPDDLQVALREDGKRDNVRLSNLRWATPGEVRSHTERLKKAKGKPSCATPSYPRPVVCL